MTRVKHLSFVLALPLLLWVGGCAQKAKKAEVTAPPPPSPPPKEAPLAEAPIPQEVQEAPGLQDIHFDFDKYTLTETAKKILKANAEWLKKNPGVRVQIEGHCDERGTSEYNLALGEKRAKSARDYLVLLGVDPSRLSTISFGEEKPLCTEHHEGCWSKNRRAHFVIVTR